MALDTEIGRVLAGRYRLVRLLGHGGMGAVYEGVHTTTDKRLAVKLLSLHHSRDLKLVARFRREALAASRLDHENCVHVDDFGEDGDGTFYIVMELIEGRGLAEELRDSGPMASARVANIGVQLLRALDAAHTAGVLHRDLKPQNVMLTDKPNRPDLVKVVDFGIAKLTMNSAEDQSMLTIPGTVFGTPEYMSPEQARGEPLDPRSDLYSAAVVLWHLLLGRSPFRGGSVRETLVKVFSEEAPLPTAAQSGITLPAGMEAVLRRAMAKRREDRWQDAASFLDALGPYAGAAPVEGHRVAPGLPFDGTAPPETLDDGRGRTLALPAADVTPAIANTDAPKAAVGNASPGAQRGLSQPSGPSGGPAPSLPRGSPAAMMVLLALAAVGAAATAAAGVVVANRALHPGAAAELPRPAASTGKLSTTPVPGSATTPPPPATDPQARDAALGRAERALEANDLVGAQAAYAQALAADPVAPRALIGVSTVSMQLHDWRAARDGLEALIRLDEDYRRQFGAMYARAKKNAEAQ